MKSEVTEIGVLGAGQMGSGIAECAAQSGFNVLLADMTQEAAEKAKSRISAQLRKRVEKGKLTSDEERTTLDRIRPVAGLKALKNVHLVIEAVSENAQLKYEIFQKLDTETSPSTLLASNTSSISITAIAVQTKRPEQVVGLHFMNPVPIMKLVEGIRALQTSDSTFKTVRGVAEKMGKTWVESKDLPGFAVNRILMPMINEAITAVQEGIASIEDIDAAMKLGTNQPMGPLTLADFIGLDTCLAILEVMHEGLGEPRFRPSPLLKQYVAAGWLGRKTSRGFYRYDI